MHPCAEHICKCCEMLWSACSEYGVARSRLQCWSRNIRSPVHAPCAGLHGTTAERIIIPPPALLFRSSDISDLEAVDKNRVLPQKPMLPTEIDFYRKKRFLPQKPVCSAQAPSQRLEVCSLQVASNIVQFCPSIPVLQYRWTVGNVCVYV